MVKIEVVVKISATVSTMLVVVVPSTVETYLSVVPSVVPVAW